MSISSIEFVWGPGGVGKSHVAIREICNSPANSLLITLDPSPRIFDLLGIPKTKSKVLCQFGEYEFFIKATDADELFEKLQKASPPNEKVHYYYHELVSGLQEFRNYLALIQLAEDLTEGNYSRVVIDTPPFHEAMGLHSSIETLREFFEKSLVQFAMRSSILNLGVKKAIEISRMFIGEKSVKSALEFIDWLQLHIDRFKIAAKYLDEMSFAPNTEHLMVLTPESASSYLNLVKDFFARSQHLSFLINRSLKDYIIPDDQIPFYDELRSIAAQEKHLLEQISQQFKNFQIKHLPMLVMGEDTQDELKEFVRL